ncbi:MAG: hypothetical protein M3Z66_16990 [Chloroflexota bacterium]|nr:hypothetical protein [Chloroflexota bacterium]
MRVFRAALAATSLLALSSTSLLAAKTASVRQTLQLTIYGTMRPGSGFQVSFNYRDARGNRPAQTILVVCGRIVAPVPPCLGHGKVYTVKVDGLAAPVREWIKFERVDPRRHGLPRVTAFRTVVLKQRHSMTVAASYRFH